MVPEIVRRFIASALIWGSFFLMYALVVGVLGLGICFTGETWWLNFRRQASGWVMAYQSARVILLAVALIFVLAQPLIQLGGSRKKDRAWKDERRSGSKG
jgi:hypothetical protein